MTPLGLTEGVATKLLVMSAAAVAVPNLAPEANPFLTQSPFLGQMLVALAAGFAGSIGAFAIAGEPDRVKLFSNAVVYAFLAVCGVILLPLWLGWEWMTEEVEATAQPPLAFVLAFVLRWGWPLAVEIGPGWIRQRYQIPPTNKPGE